MARKKKPISLNVKKSKVPKGRHGVHKPTRRMKVDKDWRDKTGYWDAPAQTGPYGEL